MDSRLRVDKGRAKGAIVSLTRLSVSKQRERMVGIRAVLLREIRINLTFSGGSSRVFSSAFCASVRKECAAMIRVFSESVAIWASAIISWICLMWISLSS